MKLSSSELINIRKEVEKLTLSKDLNDSEYILYKLETLKRKLIRSKKSYKISSSGLTLIKTNYN